MSGGLVGWLGWAVGSVGGCVGWFGWVVGLGVGWFGGSEKNEKIK